jgi:hypothetical protein
MKIKVIEIPICEACLNGIGEECHTPGCALFLHRVDLPFNSCTYKVIREYDDGDEISGIIKQEKNKMEEESKEIRTMRYMEWARVKGSLQAILASYWYDSSYYYNTKCVVEKFIEEMEEECGLG